MADRKKTRGFTLVELMLVVAIIGLLITLLVPAVTKVTEIIITVKTKNIQKEIAVGLEAFQSDFRCYPPSKPDVMPDGASSLIYYLRGPAGTGWGTTAGGLMPFGGRGQKAYGPYYEAEESRVVYFPDPDGRAAGFTDAFDPVGIMDDAVVGRILYFLKDSPTSDLRWDDNRAAADDPRMGYVSSEHFQHIIDPEWVKKYVRRYLLVSPGLDRCYGFVYPTPNGLKPTSTGTEEGSQCDDILYSQ